MNDVQARERVQTVIHEATKAVDWAFPEVEVAWQDNDYDPKPEVGYIEPVFSVESTPVQDLGGSDNDRLFVREGVMHINCRIPVTDGNSMKAHILALAMRDLFEGKHFGDLWFWECKATPAGRDGDYILAYANCAFRFQEIK